MGAGSEWIEANSGNCVGPCETHTKYLSGRQKENCGCRTSTLGKVPGGEEKIGEVSWLGSLLRRVRSRLLCLGQALNSGVPNLLES
jgi:hypothetical protein